MIISRTLSLLVMIGGLFGLVSIGGGSAASAQCTAGEFVKLMAPDGAPGDEFSGSIGAAIRGDLAVIGAPGDDNEYGSNAGSAYVYRRNSATGQWVFEYKLLASDGAAGDHFGSSASIISDDAVVIGALLDDNENGVDAGAAYVFCFDGVDWIQCAMLTASDGEAYDRFGHSCSADGDTIVVSAPKDDDKGTNSGAAYVFVKPQDGWTNMAHTAKLIATDGEAYDGFGIEVCLSDDTVIIGAYWDNDQGSHSGSAYVFVKPTNGWTGRVGHTAKLTAADGAAGDEFGVTVSLSADVAMIGARHDDGKGSVLAFVKPAEGWVDMNEDYKLTASDGQSGDTFGRSVAIDADIVVIGADFDDSDCGYNSGSAYAFRFDGLSWIEEARLLPFDCGPGDSIGTAVCIDGDVAIISSFLDDNDRGADAGAAYLFHYLSDCNGNGRLDICEVTSGTVADENGNGILDQCENHDPVAICPADVTVEADGPMHAAVPLDGSASFDPDDDRVSYHWDAPVTFDDAACATPVAIFPIGITPVTMTVTDGRGGVSTCNMLVTVVDTTPPSIFCPADVILECPADTSASVTGTATAGDVCCANVEVSYGDVVVNGPGFTEAITRTWMATDEFGNSSSCEQIIQVVNATAPIVACAVATDVLWSPDHQLEEVGLMVTVSDDCDQGGSDASLEIEVYADETEVPDTGDGTGRHCPDAKDVHAGLRLRRERRGGEDGRVYLIIARSEDSSGNVGFGFCTVVVPHDESDDNVIAVRAQAQAAEDAVLSVLEAPGPLPTSISQVVGPLLAENWTRHGISEELGPHQ